MYVRLITWQVERNSFSSTVKCPLLLLPGEPALTLLLLLVASEEAGWDTAPPDRNSRYCHLLICSCCSQYIIVAWVTAWREEEEREREREERGRGERRERGGERGERKGREERGERGGEEKREGAPWRGKNGTDGKDTKRGDDMVLYGIWYGHSLTFECARQR